MMPVSKNQLLTHFFKKGDSYLYPAGLWLMILISSFFTSLIFQAIVQKTQHAYGFQSWDGQLFLKIVKHGYQDVSSTAFFPLLPLSIRFLNQLTSLSYEHCGFIITNIAFLIALIFFYKLILLERDQETSRRALWLLAFFPMALFFNTLYTESLTLLTTVLFFYCLRRENWYGAMISGFFAAGVHTLGVMLAPAGLCYLLRKRYRQEIHSRKFWELFLSLGIIVLGLLLYMAYLQYQYGNGLEFVLAEKNWRRVPVIPLVNVFKYLYTTIFLHPHALTSWIFVNLINAVSVLVMTVLGMFMLLGYKKDELITLEMKIFFMLTFFASICSGDWGGDLMSYGRFMSVLFPAFIVWSDKCLNFNWFCFILMMMLMLKTLLFGMFVCGYSVV